MSSKSRYHNPKAKRDPRRLDKIVARAEAKCRTVSQPPAVVDPSRPPRSRQDRRAASLRRRWQRLQDRLRRLDRPRRKRRQRPESARLKRARRRAERKALLYMAGRTSARAARRAQARVQRLVRK